MKSKEEIEQLAEQYIKDNTGDHYVYCGYIEGYTQCQEDMADKKYTEEDLHNLLRARRQLYSHTDVNVVRDFIQSLQPKTEWEVEIVNNKINIK